MNLPAAAPSLHRYCVIAMVALVIGLSGCGSVSTSVRGVSPLNTNDNNESTPVDVRFFQLADSGSFQKATFDALWIDPAKALGPDLLGATVVITVAPGRHEDTPITVNLGAKDGKTRFIGVMALYRKTDAADQRTLIIPLDQAAKTIFEVTGYRLQIATEGGAHAPTNGKATNTGG